MIQEYIDYLKDNPEGYWFKRKLYGWGWTPATKEGWAVMVLFIVLIVGNFFRIDHVSHSASDTIRPFILETIFLSLVLLVITYKTGEKPKWQWGIPKKDTR